MRVVIITGAAKGIGAVISRRLAELGYSVVLADVNLSAASKEANNICLKGTTQRLYVDLTDEKIFLNVWNMLVKNMVLFRV